MLYNLARSLLFRLPTEKSHYLALDSLALGQKLCLTPCLLPQPQLPVSLLGLQFKNPVGLAAGLDKNGDYIDALAALGFGFLEIGTITPRPQPGNPQPRLFRLPEANAIINRMGFNNKGVDHLVRQVEKAKYNGVLGINIGKNFDTPVENALNDYRICLEKTFALASYITINISSPNTQGLRSLQYGESLDQLLGGLRESAEKLQIRHGRKVPLLVKIAPDLEQQDVETIAAQLLKNGMDGVIATNTTLDRIGVENLPHGKEQGGLSGAPVREKSTRVLRQLAQVLDGRLPIIGVGGISAGEHAAEKIRAGAQLVQIYTGFIYRGPALIEESVKAIGRVQNKEQR
ncbi:MAG TPA: quinone-dependent dihydroorotate dehydrogenase [Dongiaceae bacterium]|nr:quinone-dependent dihydroorotate dehydrogenase [Dongiaceae bacterium]